jgi:hypothetical protein
VEKAIFGLDENGCFNAGRGSYKTDKEEMQCDAMIMDGHKVDTGSLISCGNFIMIFRSFNTRHFKFRNAYIVTRKYILFHSKITKNKKDYIVTLFRIMELSKSMEHIILYGSILLESQ